MFHRAGGEGRGGGTHTPLERVVRIILLTLRWVSGRSLTLVAQQVTRFTRTRPPAVETKAIYPKKRTNNWRVPGFSKDFGGTRLSLFLSRVVASPIPPLL